jgi:hypothetical protein
VPDLVLVVVLNVAFNILSINIVVFDIHTHTTIVKLVCLCV